jgi:hypothetical protein
MITRKIVLFVSATLAVTCLAHASELAGTWTSEFDSQIGVQKYTYEFTIEGDALVGRAVFKRSIGNGEAPLNDIKVAGENVSFSEPLSFDGNEITITYSGTLNGDEMKLTRRVGEFATEQIVANRVMDSGEAMGSGAQ